MRIEESPAMIGDLARTRKSKQSGVRKAIKLARLCPYPLEWRATVPALQIELLDKAAVHPIYADCGPEWPRAVEQPGPHFAERNVHSLTS
jgi:hypothetical protein